MKKVPQSVSPAGARHCMPRTRVAPHGPEPGCHSALAARHKACLPASGPGGLSHQISWAAIVPRDGWLPGLIMTLVSQKAANGGLRSVARCSALGRRGTVIPQASQWGAAGHQRVKLPDSRKSNRVRRRASQDNGGSGDRPWCPLRRAKSGSSGRLYGLLIREPA